MVQNPLPGSAEIVTALETEWFTVEAMRPQPEWNAGEKPYYRILTSDSVVVLPITPANEILMVRQYRPARGHVTLEIPAGGIDPGEDPAQAVVRELLEETGHTVGSLHFLGKSGLNLSRESAWLHIFVAFGVEATPDHPPQPGLETVKVSFGEFTALVAAGGFEQLAALGVVAMAKVRFPALLSSLLNSSNIPET